MQEVHGGMLWRSTPVGVEGSRTEGREELHCQVGCSKVLCRDLGLGRSFRVVPPITGRLGFYEV